jgi:hypothetical protein
MEEGKEVERKGGRREDNKICEGKEVEREEGGREGGTRAEKQVQQFRPGVPEL